jgi:hypothetical protein
MFWLLDVLLLLLLLLLSPLRILACQSTLAQTYRPRTWQRGGATAAALSIVLTVIKIVRPAGTAVMLLIAEPSCCTTAVRLVTT